MQELHLNCPEPRGKPGGGDMEASLSQMSRLRELRTLDVSHCPLFAQGASVIMRTVATLPRLCCLKLLDCGLDSQACTESVAPWLQKLTTLQSVAIGGEGVCSSGTLALTQAMSLLTSLSSLRLEWKPRRGQKKGLKAVMALQRQLTRLCCLNLQVMGVDEAVLKYTRTLFSCHITELCVQH